MERALEVVCAACGKPAADFEVTVGELVVWPLPKGYNPPRKAKRKPIARSDEDNPVPYDVHLPWKLLKRLLYEKIGHV